MRVRLFVSKDLALRAGLDRYGPVVVELPAADLTPEEREILLRHSWQEPPSRTEPQADFYLNHEKIHPLERATREGLVQALAALAREDERAAAELVQRDRRREELRQWALGHGSELLKARVEMGFDWEGLARNEYADGTLFRRLGRRFETADDPFPAKARVKPREKPELDEMGALRQLNGLLEGLAGVAADLKWVEYDELFDEDEYEDENPRQLVRTELRVRVTTPDGTEVERWYLVPASSE
jgi:hypothetical protein